MQVTLRETYSFKTVVVEPSVNKFNGEFFNVELDIEEVLTILDIQVQMEALQQRLRPLYEACELRKKVAADAKVEEDTADESLEGAVVASVNIELE